MKFKYEELFSDYYKQHYEGFTRSVVEAVNLRISTLVDKNRSLEEALRDAIGMLREARNVIGDACSHAGTPSKWNPGGGMHIFNHDFKYVATLYERIDTALGEEK